jgi:hypothetical protein
MVYNLSNRLFRHQTRQLDALEHLLKVVIAWRWIIFGIEKKTQDSNACITWTDILKLGRIKRSFGNSELHADALVAETLLLMTLRLSALLIDLAKLRISSKVLYDMAQCIIVDMRLNGNHE